MSVDTGTTRARPGVVSPPERRRRPRHTADDFIRNAIAICEREGASAVTARRIAKEMGLSPMALYRHFQSMDHLLAVVWNEGFAQLQTLMNVSSEGDGGGMRGFRSSLRAYVKYGLDNPGLYRFMFSAGARPEQFGLKNHGLATMSRLRDQLREMRAAGTIPESVDEQMSPLMIWFVLHGLTTVVISGQVQKVTDLDVDRLIERTTEKIVQGI